MSGIPFAKIPNMLIICLVYRQVLWIKTFPSQNVGVFRDIGPREIVTGKSVIINATVVSNMENMFKFMTEPIIQ